MFIAQKPLATRRSVGVPFCSAALGTFVRILGFKSLRRSTWNYHIAPPRSVMYLELEFYKHCVLRAKKVRPHRKSGARATHATGSSSRRVASR